MIEEEIKTSIRAERFEWRSHVLLRMIKRNIMQDDVKSVLLYGEVIEDYPNDTPYPSTLFLGWHEGEPLHVVAAYDSTNKWAYIITAYRPSLEHFEPDYKTRRQP